jgi:predicted Zn finger-like uncharacterized protein
MNELSKKVSYLKGYSDGLGIDTESNEGKIIDKLLEIVDLMAEKIDELEERIKTDEELIDDLGDDVDAILEDMYSDDDDDLDDDYDDEDDDDEFDYFDDLDEELDDEGGDLFEMHCPECGEDFMIDYDSIMGDEALRCPHCNKRIELDVEFDEDDLDFSEDEEV